MEKFIILFFYDTYDSMLIRQSAEDGLSSEYMKILYAKLTKEKSALICERMRLVRETKPRIAEILELTVDPKQDPLAQRVFGYLLEGRVILVDNIRRRISEACIHKIPDLELLPHQGPELEIEWIDHRDDSLINRLPLSAFQKKLPELDFEEISIWHEGLSEWVALHKIKRMVLGS